MLFTRTEPENEQEPKLMGDYNPKSESKSKPEPILIPISEPESELIYYKISSNYFESNNIENSKTNVEDNYNDISF